MFHVKHFGTIDVWANVRAQGAGFVFCPIRALAARCVAPRPCGYLRQMIYGYTRVSTDCQSVDAQVKQLCAAGAEKDYRETASDARAQLRRVPAQLDKGDVFMVTRLDRRARLTREPLNTFAAIVENGAGFHFLGDTWALRQLMRLHDRGDDRAVFSMSQASF